MEPIVLHLEPRPMTDRFTVKLPDGAVLLKSAKSPRHQGAREMLKLGYPPETLITTRHQDRDYNNWKPDTLGELAKWTIQENDKTRLSKRPYNPFPVDSFDPSAADD